jgi:type VI secretion system protein ImpA
VSAGRQLLEPIGGARPCGEDLSFSVELDAIARARQADDPALDQGAWITTVKQADWPFVGNRCAKLLATRSKDLRLAVWLVEARAKTRQLRGLADGLRVVAGLCDRYWDQLHPVPDENGQQQRIASLCWLAARLPALFNEIPLASAEGAGAAEFYSAILADSSECLQALADLERVVDDRLGADGPGFGAARAALQSFVHCITPAARAAGVDAPASFDVGEAASAGIPVIAAAPLQDRAQALAQLRAVALYFRRNEPHSPVAYLADKAASWGEQPLHVWLRAVVQDQATLARIEDLLGVPAGAPKQQHGPQ